MPKISKKKKEKAADFQKAKLKLGKGKQQPNNATDTSYKARSIALPSQGTLLRNLPQGDPEHDRSDGEDQPYPSSSTTPTSSRGLTLHEILPLLRHPNAGNRKDALSGLREVILASRRRKGEDIGLVLANVGKMIGDEDASLRKAVLSFLDWYLRSLPKSSLPPHFPLLLLHSSSSLSHIFPEIRLDACRLVSLLLSIAPECVVGEWPYSSVDRASSNGQSSSGTAIENTILEGLRLAAGLGGKAGEGGHNGQQLLPTSKLVILRALGAFVSAALRKQGIAAHSMLDDEHSQSGHTSAKLLGLPEGLFARFRPNYVATADPLKSANNQKDIPLREWSNTASPISSWEGDGHLIDQDASATEPQPESWSLGELERGGTQDDSVLNDALSNLYLLLQPLLLSIILEAAPASFTHAAMDAFHTTSSTETNMNLCAVVLDLTAICSVRLIEASDEHSPSTVRLAVATIVEKLSPYFPFSSATDNVGPRTTNFSTIADHLCITYASIVTLMAPSPLRLPSWPKTITTRQQANLMEQAFADVERRTTGKEQLALERVISWLEQAMSIDPTDALRTTITPQAFVELLPVILSLITRSTIKSSAQDESTMAERALIMMVDHTCAHGSASTIRRLGNEFIMRVVVAAEMPVTSYPFYIPHDSICRTKLLVWLESLPRVLWELGAKDIRHTELILNFLHFVALRRSKVFEKAEIGKVLQRMIPFFHLQHSKKGAIPGPWCKLQDLTIKSRALSVAYLGGVEDLREAARRALLA